MCHENRIAQRRPAEPVRWAVEAKVSVRESWVLAIVLVALATLLALIWVTAP